MTPSPSDDYRRMLRRLRSARKDLGLTQAEVAKRLGKPQSFVSKVESGERRIDPLELRRFAEIYGKTVSWFVDGEDC